MERPSLQQINEINQLCQSPAQRSRENSPTMKQSQANAKTTLDLDDSEKTSPVTSKEPNDETPSSPEVSL
jgi:hypothetical protein